MNQPTPILELVGVYGDALRERCQELFGDGILSVIDCMVKLEKKGESGVLTIDAQDPKSGTAEFKASAIRIEKVAGVPS